MRTHLEPDVFGLQIWFQTGNFVAAEVSDVQPLAIHAPDPSEQLPCPRANFLLEVVAERPIAQHLEKRVVINVFADIVEIIVFAASADALLRVDGTLQLG